MKKNVFLTILMVVIICSVGSAQTTNAVFSKDDNLLNIGIGLGSPFFGAGYSSSFPVNPTIAYERGITDAISVGGTLSYASSKYNYDLMGSAYNFKENAFFIGARGSYHFNQLVNLGENIDWYGGASLGYVIVSVSDNQGYSGSAGSSAGLGIFGGIKYYFQPGIGVYGELGYQSLAVLNIGVAFKF